MVGALRENTTLSELRINHQRFTVSTPVEEALHELLHTGANTTLCKLGLILRNDVPRYRIEAALMRNIDAKRAARREATRGRSESGHAGIAGSTGPILSMNTLKGPNHNYGNG